MEYPFSMQIVPLSRRTALPEPRKSRIFFVQSNAVEFQMMWLWFIVCQFPDDAGHRGQFRQLRRKA